MPDNLTQRNGYWQFVQRVPLKYAHLDERGVIKHSTKVAVRKDRRRIKARKVVEKMKRALETYWSALSKGKPQEAAYRRYKEDTRRAVRGADDAETAELSNGAALEVLKRLVDYRAEPQIIDSLVLMRAFLKITDAADRRKVIELADALARYASPPTAPSLNTD